MQWGGAGGCDCVACPADAVRFAAAAAEPCSNSYDAAPSHAPPNLSPTCSTRAATNASAAYYLARSDSPEGDDLKGSGAGGEGSLESGPLKPLQREGPAKEGVEYASSHVLGGQAIVQVLQYQPLPSNEQ